MSIEKLIQEATEAMREMTAVTKELVALRTEAIETVRKAAESEAKPAKAEKPVKAAAKAEEPVAQKDEEPAGEAASAYDEAKALVAKFTKGSDRPEEVKARKEKVRFLLRHEKLVKPEKAKSDVFDVTDVREDALPAFVKNLTVLIERGDLTKPASADDDLL